MRTPEIIARCRITDNSVLLDGKRLNINHIDNTTWLTSIYKQLNLEYPKFFKMDNLSKLGILATEIIFRSLNISKNEQKPDWSIIFINRSSSLETDLNYYKTISEKENYFPSPAMFVYTLANIVTGEIAIKEKITGESLFFINENFSAKLLQECVLAGFTTKGISHILCGWIEHSEESCDALIFAIKADGTQNNFTIDEINRYY